MLLQIILWAMLFMALAFTAINALGGASTRAITGLFAVVILALVIGGGA